VTHRRRPDRSWRRDDGQEIKIDQQTPLERRLSAEQNQTVEDWFHRTFSWSFVLWNTGEVYTVESYARVRRAVVVDKMSERETAKEFGLAREKVRKMLRYAVPPGYPRHNPHAGPSWTPGSEPSTRSWKTTRPAAKNNATRPSGSSSGCAIIDLFKRFYGPTMNAFDAAEKNGKVEGLHSQLVELANAQNESENGGTSIPATFQDVQGDFMFRLILRRGA
jgi:hypothetical protein